MDSGMAAEAKRKAFHLVQSSKGKAYRILKEKLGFDDQQMNQYFKRPVHQLIVVMPLQETKVINQFDVRCHVKGGGLSGQAGAIIHGISRALVKTDTNLKKTLKKNKFTTRDSRKVERKKYGHRKARRSFQFSKR